MARAPALQEIEELPEADRLEGFPHPRETRLLFGHADAERALAQSFASGRLHHGWMIAGREGIGKATLAYRFARFLLAKPEERDPAHTTLHVSRGYGGGAAGSRVVASWSSAHSPAVGSDKKAFRCFDPCR